MKNYALELFEIGYNCAQAIVIAYGKEYGVEREMAIKLGSSLGAGVSGLGEVCGAITGASIILGLKYGNDSNIHVRNLAKKFKEKHKGLTCRTLLTEDYPVIYKTHSKRCLSIISEICDLLEQEL